ncbi:MAG: thiamine pyrophosphate-binding protein [Elusimicrobia bacterium]|nr:thiamine pyrophosphate-binding protein [Elusimicrobiota bacterium]
MQHLQFNKNTLISATDKIVPSVRLSKLILEYLKNEGVTHIFGIPGGPIAPFFDALRDEKDIKTIATRHESGAAFMALGYARVSGRMGVCCATTGPGATNLVTALAAAASDSVPVLAITAQTATAAFGKGFLQDSTYDGVDIVDMFKPICKFSAMVVNPRNAATNLRQAIRAAMTGRRGVAHLNVPSDFMRAEVPRELWPPQQYRPVSHSFDREAVHSAAQWLLDAKKPAILAGHGVNLAGAVDELLELAELLKIPVATTPRGKGAFPEDHPLSLRIYGIVSSPLAENYLHSSGVDVLFVIGSRLHEISTQGWPSRLMPSKALLHQDIDPEAIGRVYPVTVGLVGDAKATLRELIFNVKRFLNTGEYGVRADLQDFLHWKASKPFFYKEQAFHSSALPLKPQRFMRDLDECLPEDAIVFLDTGNSALWATHYVTVTEEKKFIHNWGDFGAMGHGVAACIGGKLAAPERPVIAVVGDGAFGMMGMEVLTAVTYKIPVVWFVLNDGRFNTVHQGQQLLFQGRTMATEFNRMDIVKIAEGLGARAVKVDGPDQIQDILPELLNSNRPAVVDVFIDPDEMPSMESRIRLLIEAGVSK